MKILIVDDSRAMRMIVARTLRQTGVDVNIVGEAANGQEALGMIAEFGPDLVLCDWNMPVMNGLELLTALRAANNPVRFGFVTSEGTSDVRETALAAGAAFVLVKPFMVEDFRVAITTGKP